MEGIPDWNPLEQDGARVGGWQRARSLPLAHTVSLCPLCHCPPPPPSAPPAIHIRQRVIANRKGCPRWPFVGRIFRRTGPARRPQAGATGVKADERSADGAASSPGGEAMCRICHEGSGQEELLSPCECAGTLGTIHRSCLEHWLSSSSTSICELCHFQFSVQRKTRPLLEWVRNPGTASGETHSPGGYAGLEAVGLIALTVALFTIYLFWTLVSLRYHCRLYNEWRQTNQRVVLLLPKSHGEPTTQQTHAGLPPVKRHSKETIV
ncbi:hypothetical protein SKAU_G00354500 [Synaphobranchus kaupii]|uniref:RING-type E3 ubiquitin transferase n=1 Tax=Synaphobranchus kaupii TaxID=118154 RepID=A0A9Q1EH39_SYNKA|nr:hypothetical protein SKAU_G00354500 [Synaphobranchus kaupii]